MKEKKEEAGGDFRRIRNSWGGQVLFCRNCSFESRGKLQMYR